MPAAPPSPHTLDLAADLHEALAIVHSVDCRSASALAERHVEIDLVVSNRTHHGPPEPAAKEVACRDCRTRISETLHGT